MPCGLVGSRVVMYDDAVRPRNLVCRTYVRFGCLQDFSNLGTSIRHTLSHFVSHSDAQFSPFWHRMAVTKKSARLGVL